MKKKTCGVMLVFVSQRKDSFGTYVSKKSRKQGGSRPHPKLLKAKNYAFCLSILSVITQLAAALF